MAKEPRSLRPKRAAKGKYREMLGIGNECEEQDETTAAKTSSVLLEVYLVLNCTVFNVQKLIFSFLEQVEQGVDGSKANNHQLYLIVSSEASSSIEIEITDDSKPEPSKPRLGDPTSHIDQIVAQNDQLIESMPEGPRFKKRKKAAPKENEQSGIYTTF